MAIGAVLAFLAGHTALLSAVPTAVSGLLAVVNALRSHPGTPAEKKSELDQLALDLMAEVERVKAQPLPE